MGRFSPSVLPGPSWTQGLAQGADSLVSQLMQRRQFNQQKLQQDREFQLQQQAQDVRNAEAGYTPAQPYGQNTPLDRVSNAGIADAGTPASFDPTKSLTWALLANRNAAAQGRVETQVEGRHQDVIQRGENTDRAIGIKYGQNGPNGFEAGVMPQASIFQRTPALQQKDAEFQSAEGQRASQFGARLDETSRHNRAMEARPVGGNRMSFGGSGSGIQQMTPQLAKQVSANYSALSKPQPMVSKDGAVLEKYNQPLPPDAREVEAIHRVNIGLHAAGKDTLATVAPASTSGAEKDGHAASTVTPAPQGSATPMLQNKTDQHVKTVSNAPPVSPTAPSATSALKPLGLKDRAAAKSDAGFAAHLQKMGYVAGKDY